MRKIDRPQQPACLENHATKWTEVFVTARQQDPKYKFRWPQPDCYQAVRQRLTEMTQGHCAFCDGRIGTVSRETVEHFRPKTQFPSLAYQWDNLFPCCDMCQSQKRELFEEGLLKPDDAEFSFNRYFIANYKTGELAPSPNADEQNRHSAETTIRIYGLDRLRETLKEKGSGSALIVIRSLFSMTIATVFSWTICVFEKTTAL